MRRTPVRCDRTKTTKQADFFTGLLKEKRGTSKCRTRRKDIQGARGCRGGATTPSRRQPYRPVRNAASLSAPITYAPTAALTRAGRSSRRKRRYKALPRPLSGRRLKPGPHRLRQSALQKAPSKP